MISNTPKLDIRFYGRSNEIKLLHQKLSDNCDRPFVLYGLPGIGKTQLVKNYLQIYSDFYEKTVWIKAKTTNKIQMFKEIVNSKNIRRFSKKNIAVIIDHVNSREDVIKYLPKGNSLNNITVIITTHINRKDEWVDMEKMKLNGFSKEDAENFIGSHFENVDRNEIEAFVKKIGFYPLALQQAIQYMCIKNVTIRQCMQILDDDPLEVLNFKLVGKHYKKTAYETITGIITESGNKSNTKKIICLLSHLGTNKISVDRFPQDVFDVIEEMDAFSLLHLNDNFVHDENVVSIFHKTNIDKNSSHDDCVKTVDDFFENIKSEIDSSSSGTGISICQDILPHFEQFSQYLKNKYDASMGHTKSTFLKYLVSYCHKLFFFYERLGKNLEYKNIVEKLLSLTLENSNDEDSQYKELATLYEYLGRCEFRLKHHEKADLSYENAFNYLKKLDFESLKMAELFILWAVNKKVNMQYTEADELLERAYKIYTNFQMMDSIEMAKLLLPMAESKIIQKNFEMSDEFLQISVDIFERKKGREDIETIKMLYFWAQSERGRKDPCELIKKYDRCLSVYSREYGDDYEDTKAIKKQREYLYRISGKC